MKKLNLRPVTMEDAELILSWRNDAESRKNSFSQEEILVETHREWLSRKLDDGNCQMLLMTDDDKPVGQIRIDNINHIGEISYLIAPACRGFGYGTDILVQCEKSLKEETEVLAGLVKADNKASMKCFERAGYTKLDGKDVNCYMKVVK